MEISLKLESMPTLCRSAFLPADTIITRRVATTIEVASSVVHRKEYCFRGIKNTMGSHRTNLRPTSTSPMDDLAQEERNGILQQRVRRPQRGQKKATRKRRKRSPVKIDTEGSDRAQQQLIVKPGRKIRQGSHQEGARKGIRRGLSLCDKLCHIRETGVESDKRHCPRDSLQLTDALGSDQRHQEQDLLSQVMKKSLLERFEQRRAKKL